MDVYQARRLTRFYLDALWEEYDALDSDPKTLYSNKDIGCSLMFLFGM